MPSESDNTYGLPRDYDLANPRDRYHNPVDFILPKGVDPSRLVRDKKRANHWTDPVAGVTFSAPAGWNPSMPTRPADRPSHLPMPGGPSAMAAEQGKAPKTSTVHILDEAADSNIADEGTAQADLEALRADNARLQQELAEAREIAAATAGLPTDDDTDPDAEDDDEPAQTDGAAPVARRRAGGRPPKARE